LSIFYGYKTCTVGREDEAVKNQHPAAGERSGNRRLVKLISKVSSFMGVLKLVAMGDNIVYTM
jgi:hypothetical protein